MDSIQEYHSRLAGVQRVMEEHGIDCLLLNRSVSIRYLTGASLTCSWVLLTRDGRQIALVLEPEAALYRGRTIIGDVRAHRSYYPEADFRRLRGVLGLAAHSLAAETDHLKSNQYEMIARCFGDALNRDECADKIVEQARMIKTPEEIQKVRRASEIVSLGLQAARENVLAGITESELSRRVVAAMAKEGADAGSYMYVAAGERSGLVHAPPTGSAITGGPIVVDVHASYQGHFSDMARTLFLDKPDSEQVEAYHLLTEAVASTIQAATEGATLAELRRFLHKRLIKREDWYALPGMVLHGIGIKRPEEPRLYFPGDMYPGKLAPDMTLACSNVGLFSRRGWSVRYEDTFLVTSGESVVLTKDRGNLTP